MKNTAYLILTFICLSGYGQTSRFDKSNISIQTNKIVKDIEAINIVMGSAIGIGGYRPDQYNNFINLKEEATLDELKELTKYPNPTIRCYAFWALSHNHSVDIFSIIIDHINDTAHVETQFGCIGDGETVGDFFIKIVTPRHIDLKSKKLDSIQFKTLDSILISTPNNLLAKSTAINRAKPTENLYPKIRELVLNSNNQLALEILAKYQKEQDVELILQFRTKSKSDDGELFHTYKAISQFPHPDFLPFLEQNLHKTFDDTLFSKEWSELYKAIASYKNIQAEALLYFPFTQVKHYNTKKYHIRFIFEAIQIFNNPIYEELLWKLWSEENKINLKTLKYLSNKNQDRAFEIIKKNLLSINDIGKSKKLTSMMLEIAMKNDSVFGLEVVRKNITIANSFIISVFVEKAVELNDKASIEPLFTRLETAKFVTEYFMVENALTAYQNDDITQRILETKKKNKLFIDK